MKMSDYFPLPLRFREFAGVIFIDREHTIRFSHIAHGNAAVHAINNHDRLTEENAKLRKMLTQLQIEGGLGIARHRQIDRLLNQLKDKNNDK